MERNLQEWWTSPECYEQTIEGRRALAAIKAFRIAESGGDFVQLQLNIGGEDAQS